LHTDDQYTDMRCPFAQEICDLLIAPSTAHSPKIRSKIPKHAHWSENFLDC
jgi:hypothetical protein